MSELIQRFAAYAQAFEETYEDDDWSRLEPYFAPNAVYLPGDGTHSVGRDAVLETLRRSVDSLDRRFQSRKLELLAAPVVENDLLVAQWRASYSDDDLGDLVIAGMELATFYEGVIQRLEDVFDDDSMKTLSEWAPGGK